MPDAFPTIVYRCPGPHHGPPGKTYDCMGVGDDDALRVALEAGWFATLPEACGAPLPQTVMATPISLAMVAAVTAHASPYVAPLTVEKVARAELDEKARALGLKLDKRTSDADLAKKIAATEAKG